MRLRPAEPRINRVLSPARLDQLMESFGLSLTGPQNATLLAYLDLLLRWNRKINLIGPSTAEECITRHFAESLYLTRSVDLRGQLLDIGSGAGFPGLALKILAPELEVVLLEPIAKKRAFLKEVVRACEFGGVSVLGQRIEAVSKGLAGPTFDFVTARAVGGLGSLAKGAAFAVSPGGKLCLWLGHEQAAEIEAWGRSFQWARPIAIPSSREREIWVGSLASR